MARSEVRVTIRLPWWWRIYLAAAQFSALCGIRIDPRICGEFIARHSKVRLG